MARIKKKGLDYFPMNTDFLQDRVVRRILKREGDGALAVLLGALSCIYAGEGYYVVADELFYDDLSATLFQLSADDVERILKQAVSYGIFDGDMFRKYGILTSAEIQKQYVFSTRKRGLKLIDPRFKLLADEEEGTAEDTQNENTQPSDIQKDDEKQEVQSATKKGQNVAKIPHSIAQQSTEKKTPPTEKEKPGRTVAGATDEAYKEKLRTLSPPADGLQRNWEGLLRNLQLYGIPPAEQYSLILKTNFGLIGHPVWGGLAQLRNNGHNIRLPGRYLLSLCKD